MPGAPRRSISRSWAATLGRDGRPESCPLCTPAPATRPVPRCHPPPTSAAGAEGGFVVRCRLRWGRRPRRRMRSLPCPKVLETATAKPPCISQGVAPKPVQYPTCLRAVERPRRLGEQVEDAGQHIGRDADARITHAQDRLLALLCRVSSTCRPVRCPGVHWAAGFPRPGARPPRRRGSDTQHPGDRSGRRHRIHHNPESDRLLVELNLPVVLPRDR